MSFAVPKKIKTTFINTAFTNYVGSLKVWGLCPHSPPLTMSVVLRDKLKILIDVQKNVNTSLYINEY